MNWEDIVKLFDAYVEVFRNIKDYVSPVWAMVEKTTPAEVIREANSVKVPLALSSGFGFSTSLTPSYTQPPFQKASVESLSIPFFTHRVVSIINDQVITTGHPFIAQQLEIRYREMKNHLERQLFGDGSGVLAKLVSAPNTSPWKYYVKPYYVGDSPAYLEDAIKYFEPDQIVGLVDPSTGNQVATSVVVATGIDDNGAYVVTKTQLQGAEPDFYFTLAGAYNNELIGLHAIVGAGAYGGVTHTNHCSYLVGEDAQPNSVVLSREFFRQHCAGFQSFTGGATPIWMLTTERVLGKISSFIDNWIIIQAQPGRIPLDSGFSAPQELSWFNNTRVPIYTSRFAPEGQLIIACQGALKIDVLQEFDWEPGNFQKYWHYGGITGDTDYKAFGKMIHTIFSPNRRLFMRIKNIKVD